MRIAHLASQPFARQGSAALALLVAVLWAPPSSGDEGWKWSAEASVRAEYDSNVFSLDRNSRRRVESPDADDEATGRVRGMESVDDFVVTPSLELTGKRSSPFGGRLALSPRLVYSQYLENGDKSYPELQLHLAQPVAESARIELALAYLLDVFKKSYLFDTVGTGTIDPDERIYRQGSYDQLELGLSYRRELWERKRERVGGPGLAPQSVRGHLELGYRRRRFEDFSNRDLDTWRTELALEFLLGKEVRFELGYGLAHVGAPGGSELLILDEPDVGVDLNGDTDILDPNIRTVQDVDRTRLEHRFEVGLSFPLARKTRAWIRYRQRLLDYRSDEVLDPAHENREDTEHVLRVGARRQLDKNWVAAFQARFERRDANKDTAALGDEDGRKRQTVARIEVRREF